MAKRRWTRSSDGKYMESFVPGVSPDKGIRRIKFGRKQSGFNMTDEEGTRTRAKSIVSDEYKRRKKSGKKPFPNVGYVGP